MLGFRGPRLATREASAPSLTADGEALILQWVEHEGHVLESGGLNIAFLSGDVDPGSRGKDALFSEPPSGPQGVAATEGQRGHLGMRTAVCRLVNAPLRWHQRRSRAPGQGGLWPLLMDECVQVLPAAVSYLELSQELHEENSPWWPAFVS